MKRTVSAIFLLLALPAHAPGWPGDLHAQQLETPGANKQMAEDGSDPGPQLAQIESQVQELKAMLKQLQTQHAESQKKHKDLKQHLVKLRAQEQDLKSQVEEKRRERSAIFASLEQTQREGKDLQAAARKRVRAMYMHGSAPLLLGVLFSAEDGQADRKAYMLSRVRNYEINLLAKLRMLKEEQEQQTIELNTAISAQESLQAKLQEQARLIQTEVKAQEEVSKSLKAETQSIEATLAQLQAQALRVESVLASMTGKPETPAEASQARVAALNTMPKETPARFEGAGLKVKGLQLNYPAAGTLVRPFGKKKGKGFDDSVQSRGVEIAADDQAEVRAIAAARVVFVGRMPAYGNVIILDHGKRHYSVYGRLDSVQVEKFAVIQSGEVIAKLGSAAQQANLLYFEIRENGLPKDPKLYFQKWR